MACVPSGRLVVGPRVTNARGEVDLVHEQGDAPDSLAWSVGARAGAVQPDGGGRTGLPLTFSSNIWKLSTPNILYICYESIRHIHMLNLSLI